MRAAIWLALWALWAAGAGAGAAGCGSGDACPAGWGASELRVRRTEATGGYEARLRAGPGCAGAGLAVTLLLYRLELAGRCDERAAAAAPDAAASVHSLLDIDCYVTDAPTIDMTHRFDFVFGGCYLFKYEFCHYTRTERHCVAHSLDFYRWINNSHTKQEFIDAFSQTVHVSKKISVNTPVKWWYGSRIPIEFNMTLYDSKEDNGTEITNNCSLDFDGRMMTCSLPKNTPPNNYTLQYESLSLRCNGQIFDTVFCFINTPFEIIEPTQGHHNVDLDKTLLIAVVSASTLLVLVIFLLIYYQYTKRSILIDKLKVLANWKQPNYANVSSDSASLRRNKLKGILLVYARDCKPFMEAMITFRQLLERCCNVKVYDIFDTRLFNSEIVTSPMEWAQKMLSEPGVKVVVVRSPCGQLLYEAMLVESSSGLHLEPAAVPGRVQYREAARYLDTLVLFMFRLIKDDAINTMSYKKYLMAQVTDFPGSGQLPHVNPHECYDLPLTFPLLASNLQDAPITSLVPEDNIPQELALGIEKLQRYVASCPSVCSESLKQKKSLTLESRQR